MWRLPQRWRFVTKKAQVLPREKNSEAALTIDVSPTTISQSQLQFLCIFLVRESMELLCDGLGRDVERRECNIYFEVYSFGRGV